MKKYGWILLCALFVLFIFFESAQADCIKGSKKYSFMAAPVIDESLSLEDRMKVEETMTESLKHNDAIVQIKSPRDQFTNSFGTGFYFNNYIFTAFHVISRRIEEVFANEKYALDVIKTIQTRDTAILQAKKKDSFRPSSVIALTSAREVFESFCDKDSVSLSEVIVGMKCMFKEKPIVVLGKLREYDINKKMVEVELVDTDIKGCSGAPVFLSNGKAIGIIVSVGGMLGYIQPLADFGISTEWLDSLK